MLNLSTYHGYLDVETVFKKYKISFGGIPNHRNAFIFTNLSEACCEAKPRPSPEPSPEPPDLTPHQSLPEPSPEASPEPW